MEAVAETLPMPDPVQLPSPERRPAWRAATLAYRQVRSRGCDRVCQQPPRGLALRWRRREMARGLTLPVDLSPEEVVLIRKCVAKDHGPLVTGQMWQTLDPKPVAIESGAAKKSNKAA